jgi:tetratricopeptide (TPR) repeat protein
LLKHTGNRLFSEGRFQLLDSYLSRIPADFLDKYPWIQFQQAQLEGLCGKPQVAVQRYDKALNRFAEQKDREGIQNCLVESGLIDFQTGDLRKAQDKFQELLEQHDLEPKLRIEIMGYLIYISSHFGQMDLADQWFDEAISLANNLVDEALRYQCLIWLYYYRGFRYAFSDDYVKVLDAAETMKAVSRGAEPDQIPGISSARVHGLLSLQLYSRGFDSAREGLTCQEAKRIRAMRTGWHSLRLSPRGGKRLSRCLPLLASCVCRP